MLFWNSLSFSMIQQMLAIWSLVPLPFLKPAWTSGSARLTSCWGLAGEFWVLLHYFQHEPANRGRSEGQLPGALRSPPCKPLVQQPLAPAGTERSVLLAALEAPFSLLSHLPAWQLCCSLQLPVIHLRRCWEWVWFGSKADLHMAFCK